MKSKKSTFKGLLRDTSQLLSRRQENDTSGLQRQISDAHSRISEDSSTGTVTPRDSGQPSEPSVSEPESRQSYQSTNKESDQESASTKLISEQHEEANQPDIARPHLALSLSFSGSNLNSDDDKTVIPFDFNNSSRANMSSPEARSLSPNAASVLTAFREPITRRTTSFCTQTPKELMSQVRSRKGKSINGFEDGLDVMDGSSDRTGMKRSHFVYSSPLLPSQLACYENHGKFFESKNDVASVECSVCHNDDNGVHQVCSWCAIRLCPTCYTKFNTHGLAALMARIPAMENS